MDQSSHRFNSRSYEQKVMLAVFTIKLISSYPRVLLPIPIHYPPNSVPIRHLIHLCLNIRLSPPNMLLELQQLSRKLDIRLQVNLSIQRIRLSVTGMLLDIQTNSCTRAACTRQTNDDARSVGEFDVETLVGGHAAVEVGVGEIASFSDRAV
jgi:hypothetical protein